MTVRQNDLKKRLRGLNVKHDVDPEDFGYLTLEHWWKDFGVIRYQVYCKMQSGPVSITNWGSAKAVWEELDLKDWRRILVVANGKDRRLPARR